MIYIDMEMPKVEDEFVEVLIFGDGKVIQTGKSWRCKEDGKCYYESLTPEEFFHATEIPEPHGRLIDMSQKIKVQMYDEEHEDWYMETMTIDDLLSSGWVEAENVTIIPAEGGE